MGITSVREYISWHPSLSVPLIGALGMAIFGVINNWRVMAALTGLLRGVQGKLPDSSTLKCFAW
jgi:hypothetical protein